MKNFVKFGRFVVLAAFVGGLAACSGPDTPGGIYDPFEAENRVIHEGNKNLDRNLVKPVSNTYGSALPEPVRFGVSNFASNLSLPSTIMNDLLQFKLADALHNTGRFLLNSTVGLAGVLDPATDAGLEPRPSDFGETLHVWGFKEGAYLELAIVGPSTTRDAIGKAVDIVFDPMVLVVPAPERYALPVVSAASRLGDRFRFSDTVDSILYDSADSYSQARLLYLENRRFQLGQDDPTAADDELYDLYEESYE